MNKKYGFHTINYDTGCSVETLLTGDGKTQFTEIAHEDGTVAIGMSYGLGAGIGIKEKVDSIQTPEMLIRWQVKFDNQLSVDSMIETLLRVKNTLSTNAK